MFLSCIFMCMCEQRERRGLEPSTYDACCHCCGAALVPECACTSNDRCKGVPGELGLDLSVVAAALTVRVYCGFQRHACDQELCERTVMSVSKVKW